MATKKSTTSTGTTLSTKEQYINAYINAAYNGASASEATQAARTTAMPDYETKLTEYGNQTTAAKQLASGEAYRDTTTGRVINKSAAEKYAERVAQTRAQNAWDSSGKSIYNPAYQGNKTWQGNIDLSSTVVSDDEMNKMGKSYTYITYDNGKYVVVPRVKLNEDEDKWYELGNKEAIENYKQSGQYYGMFDTVQEANDYAMQLYNYQKALTTGEDDETGSWASKYDPDATRGYDYVGADAENGNAVKGMNLAQALGYGLIKGGADAYKGIMSALGTGAAGLIEDTDKSMTDYWADRTAEAKAEASSKFSDIWNDANTDSTETKVKDTAVTGLTAALKVAGSNPVSYLIKKGLNKLLSLSTGTSDVATNQQAAIDWADSYQTPDADRIYNAAVYNSGVTTETGTVDGQTQVTKLNHSNNITQTAANTAAVIGDMLPSIIVGYGVGGAAGAVAGKLEMAAQAAGSSAAQALANGATVEQAYYTGLEHGMLEYGTESLFGGIAALGGGIISDGLKKTIGNLALTKVGRIAGKVFDTLGENVEEGISDYLGDNIDRTIYGYESEDSNADSSFLQAMYGQAPWTEEGIVTFLSTLVLGATNNLISNGIQTIPKDQANELLDIARSTGSKQLQQLAEEYQREVDRRGKLGAERAQTVMDAIGPETYAAETARRAEAAQQAQRQQQAAQNNAQVQADTVQGFIQNNGLRSTGGTVQSTGIAVTRSDGQQASFDGLAVNNGQIMAKLTMQDGSTTYDSVQAVESAVPAETAAFMEDVISTFGESAPAVYAMYDGAQDGTAYIAAMDEAINVYASNGVDVRTVAQNARTRAAEQTGDENTSASLVATLNDTQLEYAQSVGNELYQAKQTDAQNRTAQYTQARAQLEAADEAEEHGEGTIAETGRLQTIADELDAAFSTGVQYYEGKRAEYDAIMNQLSRTEPGTAEYAELMQRANAIAEEGTKFSEDLQKMNQRRQQAKQELREAQQKQEQRQKERAEKRAEREKARQEANKTRHGKRGTVSFEGGTDGSRTYAAVDASKLTRGQKKTVAAVEALTNALSIDFVFYDADARDNQGFYAGGKVYININAGMATGNSLGILTVSHELTHMISEAAPEQYLELQKFLIENVTKESQETFERKIRESMDRYGLDRETAIEEYVAQACTRMLENSKAITKLARENMSLAEKIADIIDEIVGKIKEAFAESGTFNWAEARAMEKYMDGLQERWDAALIAAEHNLEKAQGTAYAERVTETQAKNQLWEANDPYTQEERDQLDYYENQINILKGKMQTRKSNALVEKYRQKIVTNLDKEIDFLQRKVNKEADTITETEEREINTRLKELYAERNTYEDANRVSRIETFEANAKYQRWDDVDSEIAQRERTVAELQEQLNAAEVSGEDSYTIRNELYREQAQLDQLRDEVRKTFKPVSLKNMLDNLELYGNVDLVSIANELTDGAWDGVEELSDDEIRQGIREIIEERDLTDEELSDITNGVHARPQEHGVRSFTPKYQTWDFSNLSYEQINEERRKVNLEMDEILRKQREFSENDEYFTLVSQMDDLRAERIALRKKSPNGKLSQEDHDYIAEKKASIEKAIKDFEAENGLTALKDREYELRDKSAELYRAEEAAYEREGRERENAAIEKSGLTAEEYFKKKAVKEFGYTTDFREAGYLLPDGKMLDFSGKRDGGRSGQRAEDHSRIGTIYETTQGGKAVTRFISDGNVRIKAESPGIDVFKGKEPTSKQYEKIADMVDRLGAREGEFYVDITDENGYHREGYSYLEEAGDKIRGSRIVNDIKYYYLNGQVRNTTRFQKWDDNLNEWNVHLTSKLETVLGDAKTPAKMAGNQVVNFLKGRGVTAEEIRWSGIEAYVKEHPKVTRDELLQFVKDNSVEIRTEVRHETTGNGTFDTYSGKHILSEEELQEYAERLAEEHGTDPSDLVMIREGDHDLYFRYIDSETDETILEGYENPAPNLKPTQFEEFTLNGHRNYREILFSFPNSNYQNAATRTHWGSDKGVFAHARVSDQTDSSGNRTLHVEEIQSDWHNEGARKGSSFMTDDENRYVELNKLKHSAGLSEAEEKEYDDLERKLNPYKQKTEELLDSYMELDSKAREIAKKISDAGLADSKYSAMDWIKGTKTTPWPSVDVFNRDEELEEEDSEKAFNYLTEAEQDLVIEIRNIYSDYQTANGNYLNTNGRFLNGTPDAPYAGSYDSYVPFVLKNILQMAAENGYDGITWTTAEQQDKRWKDREKHAPEKGVSGNLKGYRIEYDQDIPKFLNKFGKQWGTKTTSTELDNESNDEVWAFYLTEKMKAGINEGVGMTKFQKWNPDQLTVDEWLGEYTTGANKLHPDVFRNIMAARHIEEQTKAFFTEKYGDEENWPISKDMIEEIMETDGYDERNVFALDLIMPLFDSMVDATDEQKATMYPVIKELIDTAPGGVWDLVFVTERSKIKFHGKPYRAVQNFRQWIRETDREFGTPAVYKYQTWDEQDVADTAEESTGRATAQVRQRTENRILQETIAELNKTIEANKKAAEKEAKALGVKVEQLQRELTVTTEPEVRETDAKKLAGRLLKQYSSKADKAEVTELIKELGDYIVRGTSETIDYDVIREYGNRIASKIVGAAETIKGQDTGELEYVQGIARDIKGQKFTLAEQDRAELDTLGGYENFRKKNFGRFTLGEGGQSVDSFYKGLQGVHGVNSYLPELNNPGEMLAQLALIMDEAKPEKVNPYADFYDEAVNEAANDVIFEAMSDTLRQMPATFADKAKAKYDRLKAKDAEKLNEVRADLKEANKENRKLNRENEALQEKLDKAAAKLTEQKAKDAEKLTKAMDQANERLERLRKQKNDRIAEIYRQGKLKRQEAVAKEKAKKNAAVKNVKEFYQERAKEANRKRKENASVKKLRAEVVTKAGRLYKWLTENSGKHHIPEVLKKPVAELLLEIDFTSARQLDGGEATQSDAAFAERMDNLRAILQKQVDAQNAGENVDSVFNGYLDLPIGVLDNMQALVDQAKAAANAGARYTVNDMDSAELQALDDIITTVYKAAKDINALHSNNVYGNVDDAGRDTLEELGKKVPISQKLTRKDGKTNLAATGNDFLQWENVVPVYAFKKYGKAGRTMFDSLRRGWGQFARDAQSIRDFSEQTYTNEEVQQWSKETKTIRLHSDSGEDVDVSITVPEIMSLYEHMKREQSMKHVRAGGIRITSAGTDHYAVAQTNLDTLANELTDRQKQVADALQKYMQETGGEWGNEVTMKRWGIKIFGEDHYFPIETDSTDRPADGAVDAQGNKTQSLYRIMNMGFTKPLQKKATNVLVVRDIFDVFANHMSDMAKYHGLTMSMLDMMKWYNYNEKNPIPGMDESHFSTKSVQRAIEKTYGKGATGYFMQFMKDVNGARDGGASEIEGIGKAVMSNYKVAQIGANLRVVIQQPTSIARAAMSIRPGYLLKGATTRGDFDEMMSHSGLAVWKIGLGFYDININTGLRKQIKHDQTRREQIQEMSLAPAGKADEVTWTAMWRACKAEQADLGFTGEELMDRTTERFENLMLETQVMDSTISRSQLMRSKSSFINEHTGFMSEPTLSYNVLLDKYDELRDVWKSDGFGEAWKQKGNGVMKALSVYTVSQAMVSAAAALIDAARDDDDYESWLEKYTQHYLENFKENMNPFGLLPFVSDFWDIVESMINDESYSSDDSMTSAALTKLISVIQKGKDWITGEGLGKTTPYGFVYKAMQAVGMAVGLPIAPAMRIPVSMYNGAATIYNDVIGDRLDESLPHIKTYDAGTKANIKEAVENGYLTAEEAQEELVEQGVVDSEEQALQQTYKWETGSSSLYETMKNAIKNKEQFDMAGYTEQMASMGIDESTVQSNVKSAVKSAYQDSSVNFTSADAISALTTYLGMTRDEAEEYTEYWFFQKDQPAYKDWSISTYQNYQEVEDYGVTAQQFDEYTGKRAKCKGKDTDGDGKADAGTKKAEIMAVINSLPISNAAKDKLYYQNNWASSTIGEAPWH